MIKETLVIALVNITLLFLLVVYIIAGDRKQPGADQRAGELLRALLSPQEYRQLTWQGHVDIKNPSDPGRVQVRENWRPTELLCLYSSEWVPDADLVAIHKLIIKADEETYLREANHFQVVTLGLDYRDA